MPRARDLGVDLRLSLNAPVLLQLNEGEMQQVLMNLINNAFDILEKSERTDKQITVSTTQNDEFVTLTISDNGVGVPESERESIFDLMKSGKKDGMGVGLWLSKYIIEHHQGTIECRAGSHLGAVFEIKLPISPMDPRAHEDEIESYFSQLNKLN